ncbi:MAG: sulfite oxidase-like oxidoreductase [Alphaproteobacteria bacterium]|nr:sulfite oxidase-like oxidoreductase [Alphaproteobacteria bacterium]
MNDDAMVAAKRAKLVREKERWAREGRRFGGAVPVAAPVAAPAGTGRRLPLGQHEVKDWPVLDLGTHPNLPAKDWTLSIEGLVDCPTMFSFDDLALIPQTERVSDIHCVTSWSRYDNRWRGVAARDLIAEVRPRDEARFVLIKSYDGYTVNLPVDYLYEPDSLLATHWSDRPLTREHGGPVRLVVPALYFWKSAKWIRSIRFIEHDIKGFWESRGYHMLGDPWKEQRYA